MGTALYIIKSAWAEASVLIRSSYIVFIVLPGPVGAYIQNRSFGWAPQLALWHWFVFAVFVTLIAVIWSIGKKAERLENEAKPRLSIEEPDLGYNQLINDVIAGAGTVNVVREDRNRCRIQVRNVGVGALDHVVVKLEKIISMHDGCDVYHAGFGLPLKLKTQQGLDELNEPYHQRFHLSPTEFAVIDVLSHHRPIKGWTGNDYILGWALQGPATRTIPREIQADNYELVIRAYAEKGKRTEKRFIVELRDGRAEMRPKDD